MADDPKTTTVNYKYFLDLLDAKDKLDALMRHGVDNWEGYGDAMRELDAGDDEEDESEA